MEDSEIHKLKAKHSKKVGFAKQRTGENYLINGDCINNNHCDRGEELNLHFTPKYSKKIKLYR